MSYYEKLAQVHAAIKQPVKDSVNPHFNSTFASLNECNRVVSEAVKSVGECDYWQRAVYNSQANCWEMQTIFQADGMTEAISSHPFRDDANPQKAASASTYARRYSLVSAFNLAAEDDDGNAAAAPLPQPAKKGPGRFAKVSELKQTALDLGISEEGLRGWLDTTFGKPMAEFTDREIKQTETYISQLISDKRKLMDV